MDKGRVLIAGAGPVGLVAATALAAERIPVTVIESDPDLPMDLRASTFHPPTLDMLERFGVTEDCIAQGLICPHWQFRDRREGAIATFDLGRLEGATRHPYRLQCEQWKLTRLLRAKLEKTGDADIRYNLSAIGATQDEAGVTLTVQSPDGARQDLRGSYLIGADGARSVVRKSLGVSFAGQTIPEIFLSLSTTHPFEAAIPDLASIAYMSDPDEWLVLLRTPTLWRVLLPTDPALSEAEITDPDRMEARLQQVQPKSGRYDVVHRTAYRVNERVAENYVMGRVFLAGDAAHVNNPLGGMGMNGGIHDAMNLAEKLTAVWRGAALETMGRYERQRRKVALETVQAQTLRNRRMLNERDPAARRAYHDELRATVADPDRHRDYVMRSSMLQSLRDLDHVA
jgi:3-(3-hydroxy-phenyl)propionate hydroxylase